jgi:hypothetical protein
MFIRYATKDTQARIECDRLAYHEDGRIMVLSCYGPQQTLRGLGAVLTCDVKMRLEHYDEDDISRTLTRDGCGYRTYRHLLSQGLWQFLWVSKDPQLLVGGKQALGLALQGDAFTTPLLPEWVPYIQRELEEQGLLLGLSGDRGGCGPAYLTADTKDLDAIVSEGIKTGALKIA